MLAALAGLCGLAGCGVSPAAEEAPGEAKAFEDPAPPEVHNLEPAGAPDARPHPQVTFHTAARPLDEDAVTQDWKSFLGPNHDFTTDEAPLRKQFGEEGPPLVWELRTGEGYSSPAAAGGRLVYFHRLGDREVVECLRPGTGERYWDFSYPTAYRDRYGYSNGPRASPVIDGERVYVYGAEAKLHCLELATGRLIWKRDIAAEFGVHQDFFGNASTPLVEGDRLIVQIGAPGGPTVAAFDKLTGKMLWGAGRQWGPSYSSPVPAAIGGRRRVLLFAGGESRPPTGGLMVVDPATGAVDFSFPWRSRSYESVNASCPVVIGARVFVSASYETGAALIQALPDGYKRLWTNKRFGLHWMTPIHKDGFLYGFAGRNEPDASLMCVNVDSGETVWSEFLEWEETVVLRGAEKHLQASPYRGALLGADGDFLALGEHGHLLWLDLSAEGPRILSRARLFFARQTWSPPVVSRGLLYVSQNEPSFPERVPPRLLCYDLRGGQDEQ